MITQEQMDYVRNQFLRASREFHFEMTSPACLDEQENVWVFAHFPGYGGEMGTVVDLVSFHQDPPDPNKMEWCVKRGYFYRCLNITPLLNEYDSSYFRAMLVDWTARFENSRKKKEKAAETWEKSCGAIVFTRQLGELRYVIVESRMGIYGFPKGHVEEGETEEETALREIREEVGLRVRLIPGFRKTEAYPIPSKPGVWKQAVYFLGEFEGQSITFSTGELRGARLLPLGDAMRALPFEKTKALLRDADAFLQAN